MDRAWWKKKRWYVGTMALILVFLIVGGALFFREGPLRSMQSDPRKAMDRMEKELFSDRAYNEASGTQNQKLASFILKDEQNETVQKKLIKNGEMAFEVESVEEAYRQITDLLLDFKGEEFNKTFSSNPNKRMTLVLKVPPENLEDLEEAVSKMKGVVSLKTSQIRSQDITQEYYDVEGRLQSYLASRDQLRTIMEEAKNVEETLMVHAELTRMQAEIEVLTGRIRMWDQMVEMATLRMDIDEILDPIKRNQTVSWRFESLSDIARTTRNGFVSTVNVLYNLVVWGMIFLISSLPLTLPAGLVFWGVYRKHKKNKTKK
jgi:hypothetical protein